MAEWDVVWDHSENQYRGFTWNYCYCSKKGVVPHSLSNTWSDVELMWSIVEVFLRTFVTFFCHEHHRTAEKEKIKQRETLLREKVALEGNVVHQVDSNNDEKLQWALHASQEEEYARRVRHHGRWYEHSGELSRICAMFISVGKSWIP
jgi:hypothetical protein